MDDYSFSLTRRPRLDRSLHAAEIRLAVLGDGFPCQLADVLALLRAEVPQVPATLLSAEPDTWKHDAPSGNLNFVLSTKAYNWAGWRCQPLWDDKLALAVTRRSHLLSYREIPIRELLKQPLICAQSTVDEPWREVARQLYLDAPSGHEQHVGTFEMAMTLVSAGYGIAIAPSARLIDFSKRGVAMRPLAGRPAIVATYLLQREGPQTEVQIRFIQRIRSMSAA